MKHPNGTKYHNELMDSDSLPGWRDDRLPFGRKECPKCLNPYRRLRYTGPRPLMANSIILPAALEATCAECGHCWLERPADSGKEKD